MENLYPFGYTNFMALDKNTNVKSAEVPVIGVKKHSKSISNNGDTPME